MKYIYKNTKKLNNLKFGLNKHLDLKIKYFEINNLS